MSHLMVLGVDSPESAERLVDSLMKHPAAGGLLTDAAWVERGADGRIRMHQTVDSPRVAGAVGATAGLAAGALLGGLVGLLFLNPVAGVAAGAALGAAEGALAGSVADLGIHDDFLRKVGKSLEPGRAAVLLFVNDGREDEVLEAVKPFNPTLLRAHLAQSRSERELLDQLNERFAADTTAAR
jgi:uncharacterized membrane protein